MRKFEWERKPSKKQPSSKENITIIRALNNFGRVPEQHELLDEIENLQQEFQRKDNIISELKELILNDINFPELCDRDKIEDKFKEIINEKIR